MKKKEVIELASKEYGWTQADAERAIKEIKSLPEDKTLVVEILLKWAGPELSQRQRLQAAQKTQVTKNKNLYEAKEKEYIETENELKSKIEWYKQELEKFLDFTNSEIYKAGQWLINALAKTGKDRQEALLEKELVHKQDYNETVTDLKSTIEEQKEGAKSQAKTGKQTIKELEVKIDDLRRQQNSLKKYIIDNYGEKEWQQITRYWDNSSPLQDKTDKIS